MNISAPVLVNHFIANNVYPYNTEVHEQEIDKNWMKKRSSSETTNTDKFKSAKSLEWFCTGK
jgi:hypothetical protein